ncbi:hypothetical protein [Vibrio furnissii]|uniref:hypothetical protein n=1 Tax=Vibrio furnissii TaxID=29494 RepID=UPI001558EC3C|nr:hypothetical protein [Vibrio furnissii]
MFSDPSVRKSLIVSVVASVLVIIFVQPLIDGVGSLLTWGLSHSVGFMSDSIYKDAALGMREKYSFLMILFLFQGVFIFVLNAFRRVFFPELLEKKSIETMSEKEISTKVKRAKVGVFFVGLTLALLTSWLLALQYVGFQMNASFQQRTTILAPYISDGEMKKLKSDWGLMENRQDYIEINANIDNLASENSIKLPRLLWD